MVKVQRFTSTDNGYGGSTQTWADHLDVEGVIDMLSGNEVIAQDALSRTSSHILILFEIVDIKRGDRVLDNGDQYRVTYVDNPMNLDRQLEVNLLWEKEVSEDG